jgi:phosphotransferase system  glucose/maltose/N-acetylglucosamine-specific IIC component
MISFLNFMVYTFFILFAIIFGIHTVFDNVFAQEIEQSPSSPLPSTFDDNNNDIVISEEICPPYCSSPATIQELPQE